MARQRPVKAVNSKPRLTRPNFSGSNNNLSRLNNFLIVLAQSTHDALVAAAVTFPTPPVTMVQFQTDITAFQAAKQALGVKGTRGSMAATLTMKDTRRVVNDDLEALAGYVQAVSRQAAPASNIWAQYGLIALSRFARKHQRRTPQFGNRVLAAPSAVRNAFAKQNNLPGFTRIRWNAVKHAGGYVVYNSKIVNNKVVPDQQIATVTKTLFTELIGLGNSKTYFIQTIDKFGTTGGISAPILAQAFINP